MGRVSALSAIPSHQGWGLGHSRGTPRHQAPNVVRSPVGYLDHVAVYAEIQDPAEAGGPYRYRIATYLDSTLVEQGEGHDLWALFRRADRIMSSQRGQGMARSPGVTVRFEVRETPREKRDYEFGSGPFVTFTVVQVDADGAERELSRCAARYRAEDDVAELAALELARRVADGEDAP